MAKMMDLNTDRFKEELAKRNLSWTHLSLELGHSNSYIHNCIAKEKISQGALTTLKALYNINPEDVIRNMGKAGDGEDSTKNSGLGITTDQLYSVIYNAVKAGTIDAWEEYARRRRLT